VRREAREGEVDSASFTARTLDGTVARIGVDGSETLSRGKGKGKRAKTKAQAHRETIESNGRGQTAKGVQCYSDS
jgi:hypothetical protein